MCIVAFITGYLLGSIPFGYLVARIKGVDIRKSGSGNIGFTNVMRTCGVLPGLVVFVLDVLKGFIPPFVFTRFVTCYLIPSLPLQICGVLAGAGCIIGHIFSIYLKFKGGKGVATGLGIFLALGPAAVLIALLSWGIGVAITRRVSIGSIISGISLPVSCFLLYGNDPVSYFALFSGILSLWRHSENIKRLIKGSEPRLGGRTDR